MDNARIVAQVACEYVINHPNEGFDLPTLTAILEVATGTGVAPTYIDGLVEVITAHIAHIANGGK